jgi:hypothetical protein
MEDMIASNLQILKEGNTLQILLKKALLKEHPTVDKGKNRKH